MMTQNKNQLATTTGTGVALKKASKSLKITNKLLAEVDDFEKHWDWWLSLDEISRFQLLANGLGKEELFDFQWCNKSNSYQDIQCKVNIENKDIVKNYINELLLQTDYWEYWDTFPVNRLPRIEKMKQLKNFGLCSDIKDDEIKDERFFKIFKNLPTLETLWLSIGSLSNLQFLSTCKNLKSLELSDNSISDISAIVNLNGLTKLYLDRNKITDISPLSNLHQLTLLILNGNNIIDVSPLGKLEQLKNLSLEENPISQDDINWLQQRLPNCLIKF